ncbi:MAG: hypothetical protein M3Y76_08990 [Chloroflexota bacterium]|nr:hypothetical protein [Chloroflexota bacterium]
MDEQQVIAMLKDLPLPITITSRKGEYMWECHATHGRASTFLEALHSALRYLQEPIWQALPLTDEKVERTTDEQQLIAMLRNLLLPITITSRDGKYIWECYAERGNASTFLEALHSALRYLQMLILEAPPPIDKHEPLITTSEDMYYCGECGRSMPMSHFPH